MRPMKPRQPGSPQDALTRMLAEIGESQTRERSAGPEIAAAFEGVSVSLLHKATDPDQPEDLGFRRVSRLTRHFRVAAAAEHLAACAGGVFVPLPPPGMRYEHLASQNAQEFGEAMAGLWQASSDASDGGAEITTAEARRLLREWSDVVRKATELTAVLRAIVEQGERGD